MSATGAGDTRGSKRALRCLSAGLALCGLLLAMSVRAESSLPDLDIERLLAVPVDGESVLASDPVIGASKYVQKQDRVAASVSIITRDEIKAFGWQALDEVLASLPGTHHTYDRQYSYFGVRGFGLPGDYTTRVLLTIDGNRINDPIYDGAPTGRLLPVDLGLVERIEFIPGPGGAIYGQNAMLGVINIVTRSGATVGGAETSVSWQWPQAARTARATWGKRLESDLDVVVSASVMRARGEDHFFDFGASGVGARPAAWTRSATRNSACGSAAGRGHSRCSMATDAMTT